MNLPTSSLWSMANRLLDFRLVERLKELRAVGLSAEAIAKTLYNEAGVNVSARTIANWCQQLDITDDEPEAATA